MSRRVILVCDIDNTIYDFVGFYGKAFRAMVSAVAQTSKTPPEVVVEQFRVVIKHVGSLDFRNLIGNLELSRGASEDFRAKLIHNGRIAYDLAKRKRLKAYDQINRVLGEMKQAGVIIIGATNAPVYHAYTRLRDVASIDYFSGLLAWEGVALGPDHPYFDKGLQEKHDKVLQLARKRLRFLTTFEKPFSKPNPFVFEEIRRVMGRDADYFAMGDSISKDLEPASQFGMKTIWAKYGTVVDEKNLQTVLTITPWSEAEVSFHSKTEFSPDYEVDQPQDILKFMPRQLDLF